MRTRRLWIALPLIALLVAGCAAPSSQSPTKSTASVSPPPSGGAVSLKAISRANELLETEKPSLAKKRIDASQSLVAQARAVGDSRVLADCLLTLGNLAFTAENWKVAEPSYKEAASLFEADTRSGKEGQARLNRLTVLDRQARYQEAIDEYPRALKALQAADDRQNLSRLYTNLSNAQMNSGDLAGAEISVQEARARALAIKDEDLRRMAELNLANIRVLSRDYDQAGQILDSCEPYFRRVNDAPNQACCEIARGAIAIYEGRFKDAKVHLQCAEDLGMSAENFTTVVRARMNKGALFLATGQLGEATTCTLNAYEISKDIDENTRMKALADYAASLLEQGMYTEGRSAYQRAMGLAKEQGAEREVAICLAGIGSCLAGLGFRDQAIENYEEALSRLEKLNGGENQFYIESNLQVLKSIQTKGSLGAPSYIKAINLALRQVKTDPKSALKNVDAFLSAPTVAGNDALRTVGIYTKARAHANLGNRAVAYASFEHALDLLSRFRSRHADPVLSAYSMEGMEGIIANATECGYGTVSPTRIFDFLQKSSGSSLLKSLGGGIVPNGLPPKAADELAAAYRIYKVLRRDDELENLLSVEAELRAKYPKWQGNLTAPAKAEEIARSLGQDGFGIEFVATDRTAFAITVDGRTGQVRTHRLRLSPAFWKDVADLRSALRKGGDGSAKLLPASKAVYEVLLATILPPQIPPNLVIVPRGPLAGIPFSALVDARGHYLIESASLAEAPSLSVWNAAQRRSRLLGREVAGSALIIAPSIFGSGGTDSRSSLKPLVRAPQEAELVRNRFPSATLLGGGSPATRERILDDLPRAGWIHMATHAIPDSEFPLSSSFAISPTSGPEADYLYAREITYLNLAARCAVLSACSTNTGRASSEGPLGLAWSFMVAGVPIVVATRWDVDDREALMFMREFYKLGKLGHPVRDCARLASMELIKAGNPPSVWAPWVVLGG